MGRKDYYRWESGRAFVTHLLPTLPSPSYVAVVMYCWFRASGKNNEFQESANQIGYACRLSARRVQGILADLERAGCVETVKPGIGIQPSVRCLVRKQYTSPQ